MRFLPHRGRERIIIEPGFQVLASERDLRELCEEAGRGVIASGRLPLFAFFLCITSDASGH